MNHKYLTNKKKLLKNHKMNQINNVINAMNYKMIVNNYNNNCVIAEAKSLNQIVCIMKLKDFHKIVQYISILIHLNFNLNLNNIALMMKKI